MGNMETSYAWQFHDGTKYVAVMDEAGENLVDVVMGAPPDRGPAMGEQDPALEPFPYKVYETLQPIPLPTDFPPTTMHALDAIAATGGLAVDEAMPDLAAIARVCLLSNGILKRGSHRANGAVIEYRAAGGTGARYHLELYVICGDLPDLDAGVYHYAAHDHSLRCLRTGDFRQAIVGATGAHPAIAEAPVTIAATSMFWRNAWRYQARAYRHANWDLGTTLANLLAVAASAELPTTLVLGFADTQVNALLDVDGVKEATLALVALGRSRLSIPDAPPIEPLNLPTRQISVREIDFPLIPEMHAASSLDTGDEAATWRAGRVERQLDAPAGEIAPLRPNSPDALPAMTIEDAIRRRRSTRRYDTEVTIPFEAVSTLIDRSTRGIVADCLDPTAPPLHDQYLIVNAVEGLELGVYRVRPGEGSGLELVKRGTFRREARWLAVDQEYAADAHVNSYYLTNLRPVLDTFGNRGYRVAQLESAIFAGKLHLGTHVLGLGAVGSTSFDDEVTEFFSPPAADSSYMFVVVFGKRRRGA